MAKLIGISGSLRKGSMNTMLLEAAAKLVPSGTELAIESLRGIPLYDGDVEESSGIPARAAELKEIIAAADGVIFATPEYNNSMPGVLKNAIDWISRPGKDIARVFGNKAIGLMGATPGTGGTILAQDAWLPLLRYLGTRPWFGGRIIVSKANEALAPGGVVNDEKLKEKLTSYMAGFASFSRS